MVFQPGMTGEIFLPEQIHDDIVEDLAIFDNRLALAGCYFEPRLFSTRHGAGIPVVGEETDDSQPQLNKQELEESFLGVHCQPGAPEFLFHH